MSSFEIILIAVGLSIDAFVVSITLGLSINRKPNVMELIIPGIFFGFFQALMPLIGYFSGTIFSENIQSWDHWIAFVLLGFIGGKMIKDSFSKKPDKINDNPFDFLKLLFLATATSIDALAVGITFAFFDINIFFAIIITGLMTYFISMTGVKVGNLFGVKYKSKAELFGGIVLVFIGTKIFIEHFFFH